MTDIAPKLSAVVVCLSIAAAAHAATYIVPADRDLVRRAGAILVATAIDSHAELDERQAIVTVTRFAVDEQIKGSPLADVSVDEPGGTRDGRITMIPGAPRFIDGARYLLFLHRMSNHRFTTLGLGLGAFVFAGRGVTRDAGGYDERDGSPHVENARDAAAFLDFVRAIANSPDAPVAENYTAITAAVTIVPEATFTRYDYLFDSHLRWNNNATAAFGYCCAPSYEPNFDGPGAASAAASMWSATGVIHYSIAGPNSATAGLRTHDGANTILFDDPNNELSRFGSGVAAIGGITNSAGTYVLDGQNFVATAEADIVVAKGSQLSQYSQATFNAILTHEMGHTLGFRHADGTGDAASPQNGNRCAAPLPCSSGGQAIMESTVARTTLGQWDLDAVNTVYGPVNTCPAPLSSVTSNPTIALPGETITLTANSPGGGPFAYQWFRGALDVNPLGNTQSITVSETATTTYFVRVSSSCATQTGQVTVNLNTGACGTNPNQLCINNARYRVTLTATDPAGKTGQGVALYQSNVFGYFSLPNFTGDPGNPEVFVKIVEPSPGNPWVFYAGLTNLDYTVNVVDTQGAFNKSDHVAAPPAGSLQNFGDYDVNGVKSASCANVVVTSGQTGAGSCANAAASLCLLNRFSVVLQARDNPTRSNNSGPGAAIPVNNVFGFFTTPALSQDPSDIQAFVKMVDARSFDGHFWVFLGGLTDFELLMTVTDTQTGRQKIYLKPAGSTCGWNDTAAFQ